MATDHENLKSALLRAIFDSGFRSLLLTYPVIANNCYNLNLSNSHVGRIILGIENGRCAALMSDLEKIDMVIADWAESEASCADSTNVQTDPNCFPRCNQLSAISKTHSTKT